VRRLLPHPWLSLVMLMVWLTLNQTLAASHILLGALLAWVLPLAGLHLADGSWPRLRNPGAAVRLALRVLSDVVVSNVEVTRRVLGPESAIRPAFVHVPLDLTSDWAITALAGIITMTPGTVTADVATDRSHLVVHALHVDDADALIASIKRRYEAPLREIFG
jgi:multicomponent K+:H+ antiporter subunit E